MNHPRKNARLQVKRNNRIPEQTAGSEAKIKLAKIQPAKPLITRSLRIVIWLGLAGILALSTFLISNAYWVSNNRMKLKWACEAARQSGDWIQLEKLARQWASLEPTRDEPWALAAAAARAMGDLRQCAAYLAQIPDPAPIDALHELSFLQLEELQQPLTALKTLDRSRQLYPSDQETSRRLLFVNAMVCDRTAVTNEAMRAIKNGADTPSTYAYLFSASWLTFDNGYAVNQRWLEQDRSNVAFQIAAAVHSLYGQELAAIQSDGSGRTGRSEQSLTGPEMQQWLDELLLQHPVNVELLSTKLNNLLQAGDQVGVAEILSKAPPETIKDHRFWRYKGWYHMVKDQHQESLAAYEKALQLSPVDWASQNELATVLRTTKGIESATEMLERAQMGISLATTILQVNHFEALTTDQYEQLAAYFERCEFRDYARQLRRLL